MGYGGRVVTPPIVPPLADDGGRTDVLPLVVNRDRRRWLEGGVASGICCAGNSMKEKGTKCKRRKWMKIEKKKEKEEEEKREEESSIKVSSLSLCLLFFT